MDSEDKETEAIISLSGDLLSKPEGVWGCLFPIRNPLPESFREVLRAASAFTMKRLNWCTKANEHAYMKLRQKQNWEVANASVTLEQFEQSVSEKSGRVYDLARRLNVPESVIRELLKHPNTKIGVGERGWLKPKDQINNLP